MNPVQYRQIKTRLIHSIWASERQLKWFRPRRGKALVGSSTPAAAGTVVVMRSLWKKKTPRLSRVPKHR